VRRASGGFGSRFLQPWRLSALIGFSLALPLTVALLIAAARQATGLALTVEALVAGASLSLAAATLWRSRAADRQHREACATEARPAAIIASSANAPVGKDPPARELESRFRMLIDQALVGVYVVEDSRFVYVNRQMADIFGYRPDEMLALPSIFAIVHKSDWGTVSERIRARLEGGQSVHYEVKGIRKDGSVLSADVHGGVLDGGRTLVGMLLDVTDRKRLEAELRAASTYARSLIEASVDPLVTISPEGKITDVNRATEEATGLPRASLIGTDFADYFTEPARARAGYLQVLADGFVRDYALSLRHVSGATANVLYNARVYQTETGEPCGVFAAARDVTQLEQAHRALEDRETRLKEAQAIAHVGSWALDLHTHELTWSDEVYRIFGVEPGAFGASYDFFLSHVHPEDREAVDQAYRDSITTRKPYAIEHRVLLSDGAVRIVQERCVTQYDADQEPFRSLGTVQDITERKRAEEALSRLNDELEARVEARTAELQAANTELEAFSYSVSHDLRAPLRALQGFSRLLLEEHHDDLPAEAQHYLGRIRDNAAQMGTLIDDLLTFSRLSRQPVQSQSLDISLLLRDALGQLAAEQEGRRIDVRAGRLPRCAGDPALLRQVFLNLLSNALKFTRERAIACIEVGWAPGLEGDREHALFVADNGVGFDMQYAPKLFGIFQRLHSASEYEGTGVGLAIVQRIIHRHGGRIWADASVGRGATFYFTLPKDESDGTENDRDPARRGQSERPGIDAPRAQEEQPGQPAPRGD
jgi:PAS domain S-box-containing protein